MQPDFVTAAQLAKLSGKNEKTIRRAITAGRLPAERDANGIYQIPTTAGFAVYPPLPDAPPELIHLVDEAPEKDVDELAAVEPAQESWMVRAIRAETRLETLAQLLECDAGSSTMRMLVETWGRHE